MNFGVAFQCELIKTIRAGTHLKLISKRYIDAHVACDLFESVRFLTIIDAAEASFQGMIDLTGS